MKEPVTETFIKKCLTDENWDFANQILYDLCKKNFSHDRPEKIIAKVWLIGRSYSVALERFKRTSDDLDINLFYTKIVPERFRNSSIDVRLNELKKFKNINKTNLFQVLEVHQYLTNELYKITHHNKRSFSSKYLHFHLPDLFFIYDRTAHESLSNFRNETLNDLRKSIEWTKIDKEYADFCCKCLAYRLMIEKEYSITLSNRQLDNILTRPND